MDSRDRDPLAVALIVQELDVIRGLSTHLAIKATTRAGVTGRMPA